MPFSVASCAELCLDTAGRYQCHCLQLTKMAQSAYSRGMLCVLHGMSVCMYACTVHRASAGKVARDLTIAVIGLEQNAGDFFFESI